MPYASPSLDPFDLLPLLPGPAYLTSDLFCLDRARCRDGDEVFSIPDTPTADLKFSTLPSLSLSYTILCDILHPRKYTKVFPLLTLL